MGKKGIQEFPFPIQTSVYSSLRLPYFLTSEEVSSSVCTSMQGGLAELPTLENQKYED